VPAPFSVLPSAVNSATSPTSPSRDSDVASIVTREPSTLIVLIGISLGAFTPFVDPA
jgi:hypothetical protein